jgi:tricorn protease-like protein
LGISLTPDGTYTLRVVADKRPNKTLFTQNITVQNPQKIAFGADLEIYSMDADGTNLVNLTNHPEWDNLPIFSPDGKKIAFKLGERHLSELYITNVDGTNLAQLTKNTQWDFAPMFTPGRQEDPVPVVCRSLFIWPDQHHECQWL